MLVNIVKKEAVPNLIIIRSVKESQEFKNKIKINKNKDTKIWSVLTVKTGAVKYPDFFTTPDKSIKDNTMQEYLSDTSSCIHKQPASFKVSVETGLTSPHRKVIEM